MPFLHQDNTMIFTSSGEVILHYTTLIDKLVPQLQGITEDNYQGIRASIVDLRSQLSKQLKNFGHNQLDEYFIKAIKHAESDPELYALSNAYESYLITELQRLKEALYHLRTT